MHKIINWDTSDNKLVKEYSFSNFIEALNFINSVGKIAEEINHHPTIINTYNKVRLELWTHSENAITPLDYQLAEKIDSINLYKN